MRLREVRAKCASCASQASAANGFNSLGIEGAAKLELNAIGRDKPNAFASSQALRVTMDLDFFIEQLPSSAFAPGPIHVVALLESSS